jgi:hypothetical protein
VLSVDHIAEDGHDLIVTGVGREASRNPYWRSLYRVTLDGSALELTPEPLDHDASVSEDGRWIVDAMSARHAHPHRAARRPDRRDPARTGHRR